MTCRRTGLVLTTAAAVSALGLSACANLESFAMGELPVPPGSPVDVAAREAARNPGPWPTFADIPRLSEDAPNPQVQAQSQAALMGQVGAMRAAANAAPIATPEQIEAYAAQSRAAVATVPVPGEGSAAEIEAFAAQARARATPPPPPS